MIVLESRPRWSDDVVHQSVSDTLVLCSMLGGEYLALDDVGGRVWELCDGSRTVADLVSILGAEFDAPEGASASMGGACPCPEPAGRVSPLCR